MASSNYELMLVANVERADQLLSRVEKALKEANSEGVKVERLGKKTLAYAIKKQQDGTYFLINFSASGDALKPISDKLRLEQEDLLRYLLTKVEKSKEKTGKKIALSEGVEASVKEKAKPKVTVVTKSKVSAKVEKKKSIRSTRGIEGTKSKGNTKGKKAAKAKKAKG